MNVGGAADAFRAAAAGRVDAAPGELAFYGNPEKYGVHALKDGATWLEVPEYLNQVAIATEAAIEKQGDAIVRMLAAYRKLYQFLNSPKSQEAWLRAVQKVLNTASEEEAATQWNHYQKYKQWAEDLVVPEDRVRYLQDLNILLGTQKAPLDFDKIVDFGPARRALALTA